MRSLDFEGFEPRMDTLLRRRFGPDVVLGAGEAPAVTLEALRGYFAGRLDALAKIEVLSAGTPFQEAVWTALRTIRPGRTATYGQIARAILHPKAVRAVGTANGANPIALVVPCHRVIGACGALTGFAGGMARKTWLLVHEGVLPRPLPGFATR